MLHNSGRRHDLDWIRVITIGLLLVYHSAIGFQPWGMFIGFITNNPSWPALWPPMTMLNIWRIPLLFFVAGMGLYMAMRNRNWKQLLAERFKRIGAPLIFGALCIVPLHVMLMQQYYRWEINYIPGLGHLWFLANILAYVIILSPFFYFLKTKENKSAGIFIKSRLGVVVLLLFVILIMAIEVILLNPAPFELYAFTSHGFLLGLFAFLFGFLMMYSGERLFNVLINWRWIFFLIATFLFLLRLKQVFNTHPVYLLSVESNCWIFSLLGFASRNLNKPGKVLSYLKNAAYPVYIMHMVFLYAGSILLFPLKLDPWIKYLLLLACTFSGSLLVYELIIKRIGVLRTLFGLK